MQLLHKLFHVWSSGWKVRRHVLQCEGSDPVEDEDKQDLGELPLETKTTSRVSEPETAGDGHPGPGRLELGLDLPGLGDSEPGLRVFRSDVSGKRENRVGYLVYLHIYKEYYVKAVYNECYKT